MKRVAKRRKSARYDRHLGDSVCALCRLGDKRVSALVIGNDAFFFRIYAARFFLKTSDRSLNGL